jgi:hypothetical protein
MSSIVAKKKNESPGCRERRVQRLCDKCWTGEEFRNAQHEENKFRSRLRVCCADCKTSLMVQCLHAQKFVKVFGNWPRWRYSLTYYRLRHLLAIKSVKSLFKFKKYSMGVWNRMSRYMKQCSFNMICLIFTATNISVEWTELCYHKMLQFS